MKHPKELEKIIKGFANSWRIRILELIGTRENLTLLDIADELNINVKTASEHLRKLSIAGLVNKKYNGPTVEHTITNRGTIILKFCRILE